MVINQLSLKQLQNARHSRDRRFDGQFFIAVKTTGIFCRPICPANTPKEENVEYFQFATQASQAGYRPCLRCRPESAPGSRAWDGVDVTVKRAATLIEQGALQQSSLADFSARLGISDRYLRKLFQQHFGCSPKHYALLQQLMFAKQLLHNSNLAITDIAFASGFQSVRRFNDAFKQWLQLTPSDVRRKRQQTQAHHLILQVRGATDWDHLFQFYLRRQACGAEKTSDNQYARTFQLNGASGWFSLTPMANQQVKLAFEIDQLSALPQLVKTVRRQFDLDTDLCTIETHLANAGLKSLLITGTRLPGILTPFEAGVRAILGQQISVTAAIKLLATLVEQLGTPCQFPGELTRFFPTPEQIAQSDLAFLKMPNSRRATLKALAQWTLEHPNNGAEVENWLSIKGIGPWTVQYAKLRGLSLPNEFLASDLVIKNQVAEIDNLCTDSFAPWGSYATLQLWRNAG